MSLSRRSSSVITGRLAASQPTALVQSVTVRTACQWLRERGGRAAVSAARIRLTRLPGKIAVTSNWPPCAWTNWASVDTRTSR